MTYRQSKTKQADTDMDMYNNGTRIVYFSTIIIFLLLLLLLLQLLNIIITCQILISANPLNQVGPIINLRTVNTTKKHQQQH